MGNRNKLLKSLCPQPLLAKIAVGYFVKFIVISGIIYVGFSEWKETKAREMEVRIINRQKDKVNDMYVKMLRLSFFCETFMEWNEQDFLLFQKRRQHMDSLLCSLKHISSGSHIDSIRHLWIDKEKYMREIMYWAQRQEETDLEIAAQIPVIVKQSERENANQGGFLKRLFAKRHKSDSPSAASMLHALNQKVVGKQQTYARKLAERTDSLDGMNRKLNMQLQQMIENMDRTTKAELRKQEEKVAEAWKRSFSTVIGLTSFMIFLLIVSYWVIHRDMMRINLYKKKLEDTVCQLKQTVLEKEELIEVRKKIMLTLTHDLRAPLASISSYAELLSNEEDMSKCREYNRNVRQVAGHMASMLNSLMGLFRLESGKEKAVSAPFRLCSIIETLETDFMSLAAGKNLSLNVLPTGDEVVIGDKDRIIQIGSNLLSNAIKFTEQGTVTVCTQFDKGVLTLTVDDTGSGMDDEEQTRIFTAFERLPNAIAEEGVGLGLSIVKRLVELLDGRIEVASRKGTGSRFTVCLPLAVAEESMEEDGRNRIPIRSFTALVLDNDTVLLAAVSKMFAYHGVACTVCENTRDLMEHVRSRSYDLLITDLKMPRTNGFEVLELLRMANVGNSRSIPVIASTASDNCDMEDLYAAGFAACLKKPFSAEELLLVCTGCLGNERQPELIDLDALLKYGDKWEMLDTLIRETRKDMEAMAASAAMNDHEALKEWIHHLTGSWEIIHAGKPLRELFALLQDSRVISVDELGRTVQQVLDKGKEIICLAQQAKKTYESNCC